MIEQQHDPSSPSPAARIAEIRQRLEGVQAAHRDNEVDVLNPAHHARWDDIEWLLDLVQQQTAALEACAGLVEQWRLEATTLYAKSPIRHALHACANAVERSRLVAQGVRRPDEQTEIMREGAGVANTTDSVTASSNDKD